MRTRSVRQPENEHCLRAEDLGGGAIVATTHRLQPDAAVRGIERNQRPGSAWEREFAPSVISKSLYKAVPLGFTASVFSHPSLDFRRSAPTAAAVSRRSPVLPELATPGALGLPDRGATAAPGVQPAESPGRRRRLRVGTGGRRYDGLHLAPSAPAVRDRFADGCRNAARWKTGARKADKGAVERRAVPAGREPNREGIT